MILDFDSYIINESSLRKLKRQVHGVLNRDARKRMRKELRHNIITFKFQKRNGEIRTAHGTLHPDYLPALRGGGPKPERQMVYYDLDKEGWRSFRSFKFIKILNIKPVEEKPLVKKPKSKPVKSEEEEEETKKPITSTEKEEKEEKEVKKPIKSEKEEEKEVKKPEPKKKEEKEEPESILDDKETPEEEEVIKKDKEKEKEEKEEKEDKDDKDEDKENKKTNESVTTVEEYPNVTTLGDGEYDGALWGHCFVYEGQKYYSECGWRNIFPSYCKMVIENGKSWAYQVDVYQR